MQSYFANDQDNILLDHKLWLNTIILFNVVVIT